MSSAMSTVKDGKLTAITKIAELRELRDLYLRDWPRHCVGYYCIDNFIRWMEREPDIKHLNFYTLNDEWRKEGLVVIVDRYQLFVNSLNGDDNTDLTQVLSLLDWSHGYKVSSFLERHRPAVLEVVKTKKLQPEYDSLTVMYYMPQAQAAKLDVNCPSGYEVRPLCEADAAGIDAVWPNRHQGSYFFIKRLIAWNANMGVYSKENNKLVAWCLRLQGGFLGALQVKDTHKRLGLGSVVTRATSRCIAAMGHDVMALVNKDNKPSRGMFDKIGFAVTDTCYWLRTSPTIENYSWPDGQ